MNLKTVACCAQPLHRGPMKTEKATFGAGCFWGVEETFRKLEGVKSTTVGYAGGMQQNPTYEDVCTQYRSVIFYHSPEQKAAAEVSKKQLDQSGRFRSPVVTQIEPAPKFWRAEEYHQRYLEKRGQSHCAI